MGFRFLGNIIFPFWEWFNFAGFEWRKDWPYIWGRKRMDVVGAMEQKHQDKGEKWEVYATLCDGNAYGMLEG